MLTLVKEDLYRRKAKLFRPAKDRRSCSACALEAIATRGRSEEAATRVRCYVSARRARGISDRDARPFGGSTEAATRLRSYKLATVESWPMADFVA